MAPDTTGEKTGALRVFVRRHRRLLFGVAVLAFVLPDVTAYFYKPGHGGDVHYYIAAGRDALALADLYRNSAPAANNTWPPFFAFFVVPLAISARILGLTATKLLWYAVNFACLIGSVQLWNRLVPGRRPAVLAAQGLDFTAPAVFLPLLVILPALVKNFFDLQINTLILFLIVLGLVLLHRGRPVLAGMPIALAAALKVIPALFLPYFLLRRQWRIAVSLFVTAAVLTLSPALVYGPPAFFGLLQKWLSLSLVEKYVATTYSYANQSLYALWEYFLANKLGLAPAGGAAVRWISRLSGVLLLVAALRAMRAPGGRTPGRAVHFEYAAVCVLMILLSPIAWRHYWVYTYPAAAVVCVALLENRALWRRAAIKYATITWILLLWIPYLSGTAGSAFFRSFGSMTLSALVLLTLLSVLRAQELRVSVTAGQAAAPAA